MKNSLPDHVITHHIIPLIYNEEQINEHVLQAVRSRNMSDLLFLVGRTSKTVPHHLSNDETYAEEAKFSIMLPVLQRLGFKLSRNIFCAAASKENLEILKWLKAVDCPWDAHTFSMAAKHGSLVNMKWLKENGCPWDSKTFSLAAEHGSLENIKWLKENGCPWDESTFSNASYHGSIENMKWLKENGCPWDKSTFSEAVYQGNLENMKWLKENNCPWGQCTFGAAVARRCLENMKWLKQNGCPVEYNKFYRWADSQDKEIMLWLEENGFHMHSHPIGLFSSSESDIESDVLDLYETDVTLSSTEYDYNEDLQEDCSTEEGYTNFFIANSTVVCHAHLNNKKRPRTIERAVRFGKKNAASINSSDVYTQATSGASPSSTSSLQTDINSIISEEEDLENRLENSTSTNTITREVQTKNASVTSSSTSSPLSKKKDNNNDTISPNIGQSASAPSFDIIAMVDTILRPVAESFEQKTSTASIRTLHVPNLVVDYYLNLVSWSTDNILAVALLKSVYLWHAATEQVVHLLTLTGVGDYVTSLCWCNQDGSTNYIAVGTNDSTVQLWDASTQQRVRFSKYHSSRVSSLAWNRHHWLSSGSRDSSIIQHDVRAPQSLVATYTGHTEEVCGLKWSHDGSTLASGGKDHCLCLWDASMTSSRPHFDYKTATTKVSARAILTHHKAAVKALAWCPFHRGVLASGGGAADGSIKCWNTNSGALLNTVDTGSQVSSLLWSTYKEEICSSHGFSKYQLALWKYPSMDKIREFTGHQARVLHMEASPDGSCVVSAAADETLRFWDIFGSAPITNN